MITQVEHRGRGKNGQNHPWEGNLPAVKVFEKHHETQGSKRAFQGEGKGKGEDSPLK